MIKRRYNNVTMPNIHKKRVDAIGLIKMARDFIKRNDRGLNI